jgi:hypothetical protein
MAKVVKKAKNPFLKKKTLYILWLLLLIPITLYLLQQTLTLFQHAEENTHIQMQPNQTVLRPGQTATINVVAASKKELIKSVQLTVAYPQNKATVDSVDTSQSAFDKSEVSEQSPGSISLTATASDPLLGNNLIAQISFTAKDLVDTQEFSSPDNAQAIINSNGQETTVVIPVTTVYDNASFNQKSSIIQSLINTLFDTLEKIIPNSSST